jgi:hypothetical protein
MRGERSVGNNLCKSIIENRVQIRAKLICPPGRARLATKPVPTGSVARAKTIGMTVVACLATRVGPIAQVTMMSTFAGRTLPQFRRRVPGGPLPSEPP